MNQLVRIGAAIKKQYPGEYDQYNTENVGLIAIKHLGVEYPNHRIEDLIRVALNKLVSQPGLFFSWWEQIKSSNRADHAAQITKEVRTYRILLDELHNYQALQELEWDSLIAKKNLRDKDQQAHETALVQYDNQQNLLRRANNEGLDVENYQVAKIYKLTEQIDTRRAKNASKIKVKEEKKICRVKRKDEEKRNELAQTHKKKLDEIELATERQRAKDEITANLEIKYFSEHEQIDIIQGKLDKLYEELDRIQREKKPGWEHKLKDRKKTIRSYQRDQDGLRKRLCENHQRETVEGANTEADAPRDPRQRVEKAKD
jgi:hypothetical protein